MIVYYSIFDQVPFSEGFAGFLLRKTFPGELSLMNFDLFFIDFLFFSIVEALNKLKELIDFQAVQPYLFNISLVMNVSQDIVEVRMVLLINEYEYVMIQL